MTADDGGEGGGSLALDDVTFYHHLLKLIFLIYASFSTQLR